VTTLRFRAAADSKTNLDAKVTVSGDNTTATAVLPSSETSKIQQPTYELYAVDKSGTEHDLNYPVSIRLPPSIGTGQTVPASGSATLNGSNLAGVTQVVFYNSSDASEITRTNVTNATASAISFSVPSAAVVPGSKDYAIRLVLADGANTLFDTKATVKY
jgi:hypothetical protein